MLQLVKSPETLLYKYTYKKCTNKHVHMHFSDLYFSSELEYIKSYGHFPQTKLKILPQSRFSDVLAQLIHIQGLLFKFVDFLYSRLLRLDVFNRVIKVIPSKNIFFSLSVDV